MSLMDLTYAAFHDVVAQHAVWLIICAIIYSCYRAALKTPLPGIPVHSWGASICGDPLSLLVHWKTTGEVFDWIVTRGRQLKSPIYQVYMDPFRRSRVVVTDHREILDILTRRTHEFDRSSFFNDIFSGSLPDHHVSMKTSNRVKAQQKLLAETMSSTVLLNVAAPKIHKHTAELTELWRTKADMPDSRPFDAEEDISAFVFDIIWSITFGYSADTTKSKAAAVALTHNMPGMTTKDTMAVFDKAEEPHHYTALMRLLKGIEDDVVSPTPQLNHRLTRMAPSWRRSRAHMEAVIQASILDAATRFSTMHIDDRKLDCATAGMVIRHQQNCQRDGHDVALDPQMAADELIGYLVGGYDTTSAVVMWGLKFLADNPAAQTEFRSVLQTSFPSHTAKGTIPEATQLAAAAHPLIDATIEEILRCATPLHGTSRKATVDTQILGYHVPKGTDVFFMINGPGYLMPDGIGRSIKESDRSASSREAKGKILEWDYDDIGSFRPERWLKKTADDEVAFDPYAGPTRPFGGGPRGCFGKKLAYVELRIIFSMLVWSFEFQRCDENLSNYKAIDSLTHRPQQCYVRLKPL